MTRHQARRECRRALARIIGPDAIPQFLQTSQPALGDRTGQELIDGDPTTLLERLRLLEKHLARVGPAEGGSQ